VGNDDHQQHALYRFYDTDGGLLYVGITSNPGNRFSQHQQTKDWWPEVRGISVEWYGTRGQVAAAETRAIAIENPLRNIQRPSLPGNHARPTRTAPHQPMPLVWICDACRKPVTDKTGYIHANYYAFGQVEAAHREFDEAHRGEFAVNLGEFMKLPDPARWMVHHQTCDPDIDGNDYVIDVERARTHAKLLDWTAHLMEKVWLEYTDWDDLIRRMAAVDA